MSDTDTTNDAPPETPAGETTEADAPKDAPSTE